jgi:hypothetical protein
MMCNGASPMTGSVSLNAKLLPRARCGPCTLLSATPLPLVGRGWGWG